MKKILILSSFYYPDLSAGSFRCSALISELAKLDVNIHIITTTPNRYDSFKVKAKNVEINKNIKINRVLVPSHKNGILDQIKTFSTFYIKAKKISSKNNYDVVFATSSKLFTAFLGARIASKKKIPLYLDIRDLFLDTINSIYSQKISVLANPILRIIERYSFSKAKKINIVSKGFKQYFSLSYPCTPLSYFTNGIDPEFIEAAKTNYPILSNKKNISILYAGNIGEGQGLHKIIPHIAKELKDLIHFKVIGAGGMQKHLINKTQEYSLDNVEIVEPISRKELIIEYEKSDILFLHLNNYEAFLKVLPSKLFEYAAMKKPILAGISGYSAEFAISEITDCHVFNPSNYKEAVKKIKNINLNINTRKTFIDKYSRKSIMKKMARDIYDQI
jgi:glycosyltransferase involved in cell wall biosynthesis